MLFLLIIQVFLLFNRFRITWLMNFSFGLFLQPGRFTQKQLRQPRPAHLSSTVRSPSLGSTFSINAQVTSPNNNSSTLQRIFEAGLGGGGGGDKSRTPSVPSTPQSPNAAYTAAVNAAHIDLSSINTPRFSITAPTGTGNTTGWNFWNYFSKFKRI